MNVIEQTLADALSHGKDMAGLAGKLRDKLKAGVADMQAVYEEAAAFVDASVTKAKEGLAAFKDKVAEIEGEVKEDEADIAKDVTPVKRAEPAPASEAPLTPSEPETPVPSSPIVQAVMASTGAEEAHVAAAVAAHAEAKTSGGEPVQAAASAAEGAGADPSTAASIALAVDDHASADAVVEPAVA